MLESKTTREHDIELKCLKRLNGLFLPSCYQIRRARGEFIPLGMRETILELATVRKAEIFALARFRFSWV